MLDELEALFKSETIKPTFEYVHIILALYIFGKNYPKGIGRYRLEKELLIGSGTAKSLITRLNRKANFIIVPDDNIRKGHVLTENGEIFLNKIRKKINLLNNGDLSILKEIIISHQDTCAFLCQVKNSGQKITNGIAQRDAAIKISGIGATCLVYDGNNLFFKAGYMSENDRNTMMIKRNVQEYIKEEIHKEELNLDKNDVIIIGLGDSIKRARLSALNASLTLI